MGGEETIELDEGRRSEILALEAKLDSTNLFEIFGLQPGASPDEVRAAFHGLTRKFHPDRFYGKKLGSFGPKIDRIFRRLVEVNQILTDGPRREAYLASHPVVRAVARTQSGNHPAVQMKTADEEARDAERRARLARHPYLAKVTRVQDHIMRAKDLASKEDFSQAFSLLNTAAQMDPQNAEVKVLLAEVRRKADLVRSESSYKHALEALERQDAALALQALKAAVAANPNHFKAAHKAAQILEKAGETKEATTYAQKAVDAAPTDVEYRIHLGELLTDSGMKAMAKKHFEEAQRLNPNHPEVKKRGKGFWPF